MWSVYLNSDHILHPYTSSLLAQKSFLLDFFFHYNNAIVGNLELLKNPFRSLHRQLFLNFKGDILWHYNAAFQQCSLIFRA